MLALTCLGQRRVALAVDQNPRPPILRVRAVAALVFCEPPVQIQRRANIELARRLTFENLGGWHCERYGRHEETRTPDLYRVKVAL